MKNLIIILLLGILVGAGVVWYLSEGKSNPDVQETKDKITTGAAKVKEKIEETVGDIDTEEIKQELAKTGEVVRKKAKEVGAAVADATADSRITAAIKTKLALDSDLSALSISVNTTDGVVTLSGTASSYESIKKAMQVALETDGVREVRSTLQVKQKAKPAEAATTE